MRRAGSIVFVGMATLNTIRTAIVVAFALVMYSPFHAIILSVMDCVRADHHVAGRPVELVYRRAPYLLQAVL